MKIHLADIGWVTDAPEGNRLRWSYPAWELEGPDKFLGFPELIVVERAPVDEDLPQDKTIETSFGRGIAFPAAATIPLSWWDHHGNINLRGFLPVHHKLPAPVQAVSFTYRGAAARMLVKDSQRDQFVADRMLFDSDTFYLEAPAIDEFIFLAFSVSLEDFSTLDLFKDRGLAWEVIAEIRVAETSDFPYEEVRKRYNIPMTLSQHEWKELVELARFAQASTPGTIVQGEPTPWQSFDMALGLRWEFALLYGYGFFDGPRSEISPLDMIDESKLLKSVPTHAVAYRVINKACCKACCVRESNIVVCPPWLAAPLVPPSVPQYIDPEVHLTDESKFNTTFSMRWQQFDARAIGVEFEEEISASPSIGSPTQAHTFQNRSRRPEVPPFQGEVVRAFDVPFHDVLLKARARATDAWDRVSVFSPWTTLTPLMLRHEPPAPTLTSAGYDSGTVRIARQVGDSDFPDWQPDVVVTQAAGKVFVYRQVLRDDKPRVENVVADAPMHVEGRLYKTIIPGVTDAADFANGFIIAGRVKASIARISGDNFFFEAPDEGGASVTLFAAGTAKLQQNPKDESLWLKVAEFPAVGLPTELVFSDTVPGPAGKADVLSYCTRVSYLGRLGPASNVVHAFRVPSTPSVPPPFTVDVLGIDFYDRTMVKIRFTTPVSSGVYSVWWADGALDSAQFDSQAVPGEYGAQTAYNNRYLYDVLSLPIPQRVYRTVTIGVQRVNEAGGQSNFQTVHTVLESAAP